MDKVGLVVIMITIGFCFGHHSGKRSGEREIKELKECWEIQKQATEKYKLAAKSFQEIAEKDDVMLRELAEKTIKHFEQEHGKSFE